ncbi:HD-GYP domain-containing protein [Clostridium weizhouense]|uniref:HD-GYP domain-containing protein n=1 Tax=Clostridium weizhouense TaxID=2859781 RepID=A0ABS7AKW7_9CLOT|nr:HD-GYP domain-containing protein [Clostridium weizhouense]MBW6409313.1 HD-GYP domain-containing protein [Clostridium weizhouense]
MEKNIINLTINDLKPGMIIAKDIEQDRTVLLAKDVIITEAILVKLKKSYFVDKISIYEDDTLYKANITKKTAESELKKVEYKFNDICDNLYQVMNKSNNIQSDIMDEIRKLTKELQEVIKNPNAVINDIVFYGSGNDTIYRHSVNVAAISSLLGEWLKFDNRKIKLLIYSALLHDLGKTQIDNNIFDKPSGLTIKDYNEIKTHSLLGYNIIKKLNFLDKSVCQGILMHHEREDGSGYPLGIKGDKIPKFAKIIAIADVFDAINSDRSYRKKKTPFEAIQIIRKESFGKLDYNYCNVFLNHIINYYMGRNVLLNNDETGKIVQMDINELDKPLIFLNNEFVDLKEKKKLKIERFIL